MGLLDLFRANEKKSASVAKERLQLIVAHRRAGNMQAPVFLPKLQEDLLEVIRKYVQVSDDAVKIDVERDGDMDVLELNIVVPDNRD
ncbi:cell division topological specificity factor [Oceanococcus atlanticus]|uniref:Cell division topological specificity factor n=1 Tax=Oceanococcus atlanticus TaxID=1317117 RepID=A0A1Y1SA93_9GAMM|nr:cell division topological specificity factor MinE [Oceanococcus atlanticus]ORE85199.1 cell division topological specificity factor [Oceanococcus atlanticus]RZO83938.1 MAG: cell division topological specificity factor MinE [Oceanococcus sp.]